MKVGGMKVGHSQVRSTEVSQCEIGLLQIGHFQCSGPEVSPREIHSAQIDTGEIDSTEEGSAKIKRYLGMLLSPLVPVKYPPFKKIEKFLLRHFFRLLPLFYCFRKRMIGQN